MTKWKIYNEDAVEWAKNYQKGKFHALLCDAPYHLTSPSSKSGSQPGKESPYGRHNYNGTKKGFMGQKWDGGDIAFRPETWEAFKEVLYPGAFGMAFSASRNWHRMAVAIEDAGFIIHPTMFFLWVQGQGFPKATNISKQLEKGKVVGTRKTNVGMVGNSFARGNRKTGDVDIMEYETITGSMWEGHRYGLQALKPSVEPIIVFQKPYEGKPLDNIVSTGAGALNIDGGRIPLATDDEYTINTFDDGAKPFGNGAGHQYTSRKIRVPQSDPSKRSGIVGTDLGISRANIEKFQESQRESIERLENMGRWPSNLILDNKVEMEQSNFFYQVSTQLDEADPFYYCAKVSPKERNAGLDDMPEVLGGSLDGGNDTRNGKNKAQLHPTKNNHPTLKPIALAKYLATLLLPPDEYAPRRIFIPFSGSGSEMCGAGLAGWEHVVGVEFDKENGYVDIAKKRLEHWLALD